MAKKPYPEYLLKKQINVRLPQIMIAEMQKRSESQAVQLETAWRGYYGVDPELCSDCRRKGNDCPIVGLVALSAKTCVHKIIN